MNKEEIKTDHFKTMEELLKHLKIWEKDDDYEAYCRFFDERCAYEMAHYIDKQEKIIDNLAQWVSNLSPIVDKQAVKDIIYKENKSE